MWGHNKNRVIYQPRKEALPEINTASTFDLRPPVSGTEKIHFCCLSYPLCGILLLQPGKTGGGGLVTKSWPTIVTLWTIACQAPLSLGFAGKSPGMGFHFLLQGIFLIHGSNPCLLQCRQILYHWATNKWITPIHLHNNPFYKCGM